MEILTSENVWAHFQFAINLSKNANIWNLHGWFLASNVLRSEFSDEIAHVIVEKLITVLTCLSFLECRIECWDISAVKFTQVTNRCILGKMGVSRTHPGFLTVLAKMQTCVLGQYLGHKRWRFTRTQGHKYRQEHRLRKALRLAACTFTVLAGVAAGAVWKVWLQDDSTSTDSFEYFISRFCFSIIFRSVRAGFGATSGHRMWWRARSLHSDALFNLSPLRTLYSFRRNHKIKCTQT